MSNKDKIAAGILAGISQGREQAKTDRKIAAEATLSRAVTVLPPELLRMREEDTRQGEAPYVVTLAENIAAVGLLSAVTVDATHRLVDGLNRFHACRLLLLPPRERVAYAQALPAYEQSLVARIKALPAGKALPHPLSGGRLPVRVMTELDANKKPAEALAAEVAANTARKDYTPAEIKDLTERLRKAGYKETAGRPKRGEKALRPALELILGVSPDTVRRLLGKKAKHRQMPTFSALPSLRRHCERFAAQALPAGARLPAVRQAQAIARNLAEALESAEEETKSL